MSKVKNNLTMIWPQVILHAVRDKMCFVENSGSLHGGE
jgi:hypothetical protein